jgi:hypothetical protein
MRVENGKRRSIAHRLSVLVIAVMAMLLAFQATALADPPMDIAKVASIKPELKVLVLVDADQPISLSDLERLHDQGLIPADRDPGLIIGLRRAVFATTARQWALGLSLPSGLHAKRLRRFVMTGIYRVAFSVEASGYSGPLTLEITGPRDGFGKELVACEHRIRPAVKSIVRVDSAGNRWIVATYPRVMERQKIRFRFGFKYVVDMDKVLAHDLALAPEPVDEELPAEVTKFLRRGHKIDPTLPRAVAWAAEKCSQPPDARLEFSRLSTFLKKSIQYDKRKRQDYFGGRAVYADLDYMYQDASVTLERRTGCCPDTVLLECVFMRARGIPCRTAGRFGHFFSEVFLRGRGWMSTSVTPTGLPLIVAPGPDHVPYQKWSPRIPLRTTNWESRIRIEPLEE